MRCLDHVEKKQNSLKEEEKNIERGDGSITEQKMRCLDHVEKRQKILWHFERRGEEERRGDGSITEQKMRYLDHVEKRQKILWPIERREEGDDSIMLRKTLETGTFWIERERI